VAHRTRKPDLPPGDTSLPVVADVAAWRTALEALALPTPTLTAAQQRLLGEVLAQLAKDEKVRVVVLKILTTAAQKPGRPLTLRQRLEVERGLQILENTYHVPRALVRRYVMENEE
jgi:uncharacterized protein (DUF2236 family)